MAHGSDQDFVDISLCGDDDNNEKPSTTTADPLWPLGLVDSTRLSALALDTRQQIYACLNERRCRWCGAVAYHPPENAQRWLRSDEQWICPVDSETACRQRQFAALASLVLQLSSQ